MRINFVDVLTQRAAMVCFGCLFLILICGSSRIFAETQNVEMSLSVNVVLAAKNCQLAIWLVDARGTFVDTLYVTRKVGQKGLGNRGGGIDDKWGGSRLSALPVWAHQRGIDYGGGNFYPTKDKPLADAVSAATPKAGNFVLQWQPKKMLQPGRYDCYIEVNKSFDDNESHDYSWYRGQPSVIWMGSILIADRASKSKAAIIGRGHVAGMDGSINPDLSTLTTANQLIEKAEVIYKPTSK